MRPVLFILILVCLMAGCSQDPNAPVYDTKANPDNFSQTALDLITDIESGQLSEFNQIVLRFADLYTGESLLLDNMAWKNVIDRLGVKFQYRAEMALEKGLTGYNEAATNYILASFAHPGDQELNRLGRVFSTWSVKVSQDTVGQYDNLASANLSKRVKLLKQFELTDSLSRAFSREYLRPVIFGENGISGYTSSQIDQLTPGDLCLLDYAGLAPYETKDFVAIWGEPSVKLVSAEVIPTRPGWYQIELYFVADNRLDQDYTIALQAMTEDTLPSISDGELDYIPFDFSPVTPTSHWTPGRIMATAKPIYFDQPLKQLRIGLYQRDNKTGQLKLNQSDEALYTLVINPETR